MQAAGGTFVETRGQSDWRLGIAVVAVWAVVAILLNWNSGSSDLAPLYLAGHALAEGRPDLVYASTQARVGMTPPEWMALVHDLGDPWAHAFPYLYPPLWAKLMSWVTPSVAPVVFNHAVVAWHMLATALSILLAARIARPEGMRPFVWCLVSVGLVQFTVFSQVAFHFNQPQITIMFLILLAFERLSAGRDGQAGLLLGLAAAIKILPGIFVLLFLLDRRWRAAAVFAATVAGLAALSVLLAGPALHSEYVVTLANVRTMVPLVPSNATLVSALVFLADHAGLAMADLESGGGYFDAQTLPALPWLLWVARFAFAGTALAFARRLAPLAQRPRIALGLLALSIAIPLFGSMGWLHYYFLTILLLPQLFPLAPPRVSALAFVVFAGTTSSTLYIEWVMAFGLDWRGLNISVAAAWLVILWLVWLAAGRQKAMPARG